MRSYVVISTLLVPLLFPPTQRLHGSRLVGFASAMRRADVSPDGSAPDYEDEDDYEDEYEDEYGDDEEFEHEEVVHETYAEPNSRESYEAWENSEMTTEMWRLIDRGDMTALQQAIERDSNLVYLRSEDGRGPLFWAYEYEKYDMVKLLLDKGM